ncbi:MAG: mechanosensitive ion channel [Gammaproteobacteria bacterium]|nr:mechanosensitive ion channel [Gammaproteobacteria bacterium]
MDDVTKIDANKYLDLAIEMAMGYAPTLALAIVTLVVGLWIVGRVTAGVGRALERGGMEVTLQRFVHNLLNIGLKALLLISVAGMVGIETTSFIAVLGAAGLAIGFALQGSLANFAGGVLILVLRPYKVGDFIDTNGLMGTVQQIGIFNTTMTTPDNKTIIIPNGAISNSPLTNFSTQAMRRVDAFFGISYGDDLKQAKQILRELIDADERILKVPESQIFISNLGDNSVNIGTRAWVDAADYFPVLWDLNENAKLAFDEAGITIPFPQRDVHVYQHDVAT